MHMVGSISAEGTLGSCGNNGATLHSQGPRCILAELLLCECRLGGRTGLFKVAQRNHSRSVQVLSQCGMGSFPAQTLQLGTCSVRPRPPH